MVDVVDCSVMLHSRRLPRPAAGAETNVEALEAFIPHQVSDLPTYKTVDVYWPCVFVLL